MMPTSQMRSLRELEPPSTDEGLQTVEVMQFARAQGPRGRRTAVFVAAGVLREPGWAAAIAQGNTNAPHLIYDWAPDATTEALDPCLGRLAATIEGPVEAAVCPHAGGPPRCWCRPPLPGLPLAFARTHEIALAGSIVIGAGPAHRTLATTLGAMYVSA